jgi:hypothetical protein
MRTLVPQLIKRIVPQYGAGGSRALAPTAGALRTTHMTNSSLPLTQTRGELLAMSKTDGDEQ